jgi:excisionase family DNA binding protein
LRARGDLEDGELVLRAADGTEINLPHSLLRLVVSAANSLAAGHAIMAIPAEVTLTPAEAAELLGLSHPFVAKLLERGDISSELLPESRHRKIRLEDVLEFQARRERRAEGRRRIADIAATADLPYLSLGIVARVFVDTNVLFPHPHLRCDGNNGLVCHLRKLPGGEIATTYLESFECVWDGANPYEG